MTTQFDVYPGRQMVHTYGKSLPHAYIHRERERERERDTLMFIYILYVHA